MTIQLRAGTIRTTLDPLRGGRLASLVVDGHERLIVAPDETAALPDITWGSFPMVPWVGRLRHGSVEWGETSESVPRNLAGHAIHGLGFARPWQVQAATSRSANLRLQLGAADGWPFAVELDQTIELAADVLTLTIVARADVAMPFAAGWHPWFRRIPGEPIRIKVPADHVLETIDLIPTGGLLDVTGAIDLRRPVDVGDRRLDHAYVGISGTATVAWPDLEIALEATPLGAMVVHTTPDAVCIEPQTAWPDAIRLSALGADTGLAILEPRQAWTATSRWAFRRIG